MVSKQRIDHWKSVHLDAIKTKLIELKWDGSMKKHKDKSSAMLEVFIDLARMTADKTEVGTQFKGKLQRKIRSLGKEISEAVVDGDGPRQSQLLQRVYWYISYNGIMTVLENGTFPGYPP